MTKETALTELKLTRTAKSRIGKVDFSNLVFGKIFTDHMFVCNYANGAWQTPEIMPYQKLELDPSARVFHYGQAIFEGMKAYKDDKDQIWLFRPHDNLKRINDSARRMAIPEFPEDYFMEGLRSLLLLDADWIKKGLGNSLYVRPFVIATEPSVMASPANEYKFLIICSPAQAYYGGEVRVKIMEKYSRAAAGGFGYAKAAGNYGGQFYPTSLANKEGFQQVIWTDANTHQYLEEAGTMNIFFRIDNKLITCPISDRILDGITRRSVLQLAETHNLEVEVRPIKVGEVISAAKRGTLKEIFGSGTAAVINPIAGIGYRDEFYQLPVIENSYAAFFKENITNIQYNMAPDPYGWRFKVAAQE